jgi:hypothetical protein
VTEDIATLLAVAAKVLELQEEEAVLLGGVAVHLRTRSADVNTIPVPDEVLARPESLASAVRPTADVDMCARSREAKRSIIARLEQLDFEPTPDNPSRFQRGAVTVDVLTSDTVPYVGLVLAHKMSSPLSAGGDTPPLRVADSAALVVTKSHAWKTRRAQRDLVDLARLAFSDLPRGDLPGTLRELIGAEPQLFDVLRETWSQFETPDSAGPVAFFQALLSSTFGVSTDQWLALEKDIRVLTSQAVGRLFAECGFVLDE